MTFFGLFFSSLPTTGTIERGLEDGYVRAQEVQPYAQVKISPQLISDQYSDRCMGYAKDMHARAWNKYLQYLFWLITVITSVFTCWLMAADEKQEAIRAAIVALLFFCTALTFAISEAEERKKMKTIGSDEPGEGALVPFSAWEPSPKSDIKSFQPSLKGDHVICSYSTEPSLMTTSDGPGKTLTTTTTITTITTTITKTNLWESVKGALSRVSISKQPSAPYSIRDIPSQTAGTPEL